MSLPARSKVETCACGDPNGSPSNQELCGEVVEEILKSSNPVPGDTETLKQVGGLLPTEEPLQTSSTLEIIQPANVKAANVQMTSKYKTKEEKKKARQARRKANRAKYCRKRGNTRKPNKTNTSKEKICSLENQNQVPKEQPPTKLVNKGNTVDDLRSSINKCRHLAVAVRRVDKAPVDKELAKLIRQRLTDLIGEEVKRVLANNSSGRLIQFLKSGLVSTGSFLVTPATEEARDWLLSRDFGLLDGIRVVAKKLLERKKVKSPEMKRLAPIEDNKSTSIY